MLELLLLIYRLRKKTVSNQPEDIQPLEDDKRRCREPESDAESKHSLYNTDTVPTYCEENESNEGVQE